MAATFDESEEIFRELAVEYADHLEETLLEVENFVIAYGKTGNLPRELLRHVHSMKGAAGSFGLPIVTTICHEFEDLLLVLKTGVTPSPSQIDGYLRYVDLLRRSRSTFLDQSLNQDQRLTAFAGLLEELHKETSQGCVRILIAEESRSLVSMIETSLAGTKVKVTHVQDGLVALTRVLSEPFDVLVSSKHLRTLDGRAVFAAIKLSGRKVTPSCVLITSDLTDPLNKKCGADAIISKTQQGFAELKSIAMGLTQATIST